MKTWKEFKENLGGGLPSQVPNYAGAARSVGGHQGEMNIGQAHLTLVGQHLQIDTGSNSMALQLTPQQIAQFQSEFGQAIS